MGDRGWRINFGGICQPDNFAKIQNGYYDPRNLRRTSRSVIEELDEQFTEIIGHVLPIIAESIQQDSAGRLQISPTPELTKIQEESPHLWLVVLASDNRQVQYGAAHELRTPIAILHTNLEAMPTSRQQQKLLNDVGRLANTAEQLLDLHRMDNGMQRMQEVDLVQLCKSVAGDLAPNAIAAGYELSFSTDGDRMPVQGDAGALERAVSNLVRNAIEHGGGRGSIRVVASHPNVIEVSDEGSGIPADQREDVFEPFYRASPKHSGAGLGRNADTCAAEAL